VIALLTLAIAFGVSAQDGSGTGGTSSGQTSSQQGFSGQSQNFGQGNIGFTSLATNGQEPGLFPSGAGNNFFFGLNGAMPRNASLLGVAFLDGFSTYTFDMNSLFNTQINAQTQQAFNTQNQQNLNNQGQTQLGINNQGQQGFNTQQDINNLGVNAQGQNQAQFANLQQCGNVRVYKLSPQGVQDLWPNVSCNGSLLNVQAGGSGHYILYRFNGNQSAVSAPAALFPCNAQASLDINIANQAGTQAQAGNVVCVSAQGGFGTTAGQGTIQGQQTQQTQTNQGDDSGDDTTSGSGTGTGSG
jgi:hypothetical protein